MRAFGWLAIAVVAACGGGDGTEDTDEPGTSRPTGNTEVGLCDGVPSFNDIGDMTCDQLTSAFEQRKDAAYRCEAKSDCQVLSVNCVSWGTLGCYYPANTCFDDIAVFNNRASEAGCQIPVGACVCTGAPAVDCVEGECQFTYDY